MGKIVTGADKDRVTVNTNNVWERIVQLENKTLDIPSNEDFNSLSAELAQNAKKIGVEITEFGANGNWNGTTGTDNTSSIQQAIDNATPNSKIVIPYSDLPYLVSGSITLKSNIEIICLGELFLTSGVEYKSLFTGNGVENIKLHGFKVYSSNNQTRKVGRPGLGSNVYFFQSNNIKNLTIDDLYIENLEYGVKINSLGSHITINNFESLGTYQPIYLSDVQVLRGNKWHMDNPLSDVHDHHLYWNSGIVDAVVTDIVCKGASGPAIAIANTNETALVNENITLRDLKFFDVSGAFAFNQGSTKNIKVDGVYGNGCSDSYPWVMTSYAGTGKSIEDITISNFYFENNGYALYNSDLVGFDGTIKNVHFENGECKGLFASHVLQPAGTKKLSFKNVTFRDVCVTNTFLFTQPTAKEFRLEVIGCKLLFETSAPTAIPITARNNSYYEVIVKNSSILNLVNTYVGIVYNFPGTSALSLFIDNEIQGFTNVLFDDVTTTTLKTFNRGTKTYIN